jgi:hypothetical protein
MPISRIVLTFVAGALLATDAWAQQGRVMHPDAGCTATAAQLEANKKVAMAFFAPGADRVALADPSYKQHNPTASPGTWYEVFTFECFAFAMADSWNTGTEQSSTLQHLRQAEDSRPERIRQSFGVCSRMCSCMYSASATFLSL